MRRDDIFGAFGSDLFQNLRGQVTFEHFDVCQRVLRGLVHFTVFAIPDGSHKAFNQNLCLLVFLCSLFCYFEVFCGSDLFFIGFLKK